MVPSSSTSTSLRRTTRALLTLGCVGGSLHIQGPGSVLTGFPLGSAAKTVTGDLESHSGSELQENSNFLTEAQNDTKLSDDQRGCLETYILAPISRLVSGIAWFIFTITIQPCMLLFLSEVAEDLKRKEREKKSKGTSTSISGSTSAKKG